MAFIERVPNRDDIRRAYDLWSHFYDTVAAPWEAGARMRALGAVCIGQGDRILDVGVGSGAFFNQIVKKAGHHASVYGIDLSRGMVHQAGERLEGTPHNAIRLVQADALSLPFANESFDVVSSSYVLDLLQFEDIFRVLTEFRRVLKPMGRTVLVNLTKVDPDRRTWYERWYDALPSLAQAYVLGGCRPVCLENLLAAAGFVALRRALVPQALSSEILIGDKPSHDDNLPVYPASCEN